MSRKRRRRGIVNVRMVITEEKIISNIDKIQKLINPKSKKQIVKLEEDTYFKDMVEAIKVYLVEYPNKKNFPADVYKSTFGLVEYSISQFEENTKKIEDLIVQREKNISLAESLRKLSDLAEQKADWFNDELEEASEDYAEEIVDALKQVYTINDVESEDYTKAVKFVQARVSNLEGNLHIEIDMERVTDRSKALSYIGIEIAEALKTVPAPISLSVIEPEVIAQETEVEETVIEELKTEDAKQENIAAIESTEEVVENVQVIEEEQAQYAEESTFEVKQTMWQKIVNSKLVRSIKYITRIRVKLDYSALPEGTTNNN